MMFQASDVKGRQFLELLNDNLHPIKPSYFKGGSWLKFFGHSNSLCARVSRAIVNYCHMQVHLSGNNVSVVKPLPSHTSPPSMAATFLVTRLRAVLQPSGYSVFHGGEYFYSTQSSMTELLMSVSQH